MRKEAMILSTNTQLVLCIINEVTVEIWVDDHLDFTGKIIGISDELLEVDGCYYKRARCMVRTYENILKKT